MGRGGEREISRDAGLQKIAVKFGLERAPFAFFDADDRARLSLQVLEFRALPGAKDGPKSFCIGPQAIFPELLKR